jgi:hypothetical protein
MKKRAVVFSLLCATSMAFGATSVWNPAASSDDFAAAANWGGPAWSSTVSDILRVGATTSTYPNSASLAKLTTSWGALGAYGSDYNDTLQVGAVGYKGNVEVAIGSGNTAYFKSILVGDNRYSATEGASVMTITSGTLRGGAVTNDRGYMVIGKNNSTSPSPIVGIGHLNVSGGTVAMDRIAVGEVRSGFTINGIGHVLLENDGKISLACERAPDSEASFSGFKLNNGDFTWKDNGDSSFLTGALSVNTGTLIFQSSDDSFGTEGKGIQVVNGLAYGNGTATLSANALIDVTGLAVLDKWVTLITADSGFSLADESLLTTTSIDQGWKYRFIDADGATGNAIALQVSVPEPSTLSLLSLGALFLLRRKQ